MDPIFTKTFSVASYEVDPFGDVRPSAVMNYLQETADIQSIKWKLSVVDMFKIGKTWVMTRYRLKFLHRPRIGAEVTVSTWSSGREGRFALRDFEVKTSDGTLVALATASYALIDMKERKPVVIGEILPTSALHGRRVIEEPLAAVPQLDRIDREVSLPVMLRDLDLNGHVNHVVYVQWALEAVPLAIWQRFRPVDLEIEYRAETRYGDSVRVAVSIDEGGEEPVVVHRVHHAESGTELARLKSRWKNLEMA